MNIMAVLPVILDAPFWEERGWEIVTGSVVTIIATIAIIVLSVFLNHAKKNDEAEKKRVEGQEERFTAQVRAQEQKLQDIMGIIMKMVDQISASTNHTHSIPEEDKNSKIDAFIGQVINDTLNRTKAVRAYVVSFHNGTWDNTGRSLRKMSITSEAAEWGEVSVMNSLQNMPRSYLQSLDTLLEENSELFYPSVNGLQTDAPLMGTWFLEHRCEAVGMCAIYHKVNNENLLAGFIVIEFKGSMQDPKVIKKNKIILAESAARIAAVSDLTGEHLTPIKKGKGGKI